MSSARHFSLEEEEDEIEEPKHDAPHPKGHQWIHRLRRYVTLLTFHSTCCSLLLIVGEVFVLFVCFRLQLDSKLHMHMRAGLCALMYIC